MSTAVTLRALAKQVSASISATDLAAGTFAIGGDIPIEQPQGEPSATSTGKKETKSEEKKASSAPVILRWDNPEDHPGPHRVSFPVTSDEDTAAFEHLLKASEKATFGLNGRHEFDETYRKAQKLGADDFCTTFCPYETGIIDAVCQVLLPSFDTAETKRSLRAELYNMNIYSGPSGKFKAHVDTPRSSYQIGSLVVCLPMKHEGGELAVRHNEITHSFDWAENSKKPSIQWAAFYSDCEHEVFEVKSGHRITLTYNLYATAGNGALAGQTSAFNPNMLPLYQEIKAMVTSTKFQAKSRLLGIYSTYAYPHTENKHGLPFCLKGIDMVLYEIFKSLGLKIHLCAILENPMSQWNPKKLDDGEFSDGAADVDSAKKTNKSKKSSNKSGDSTETDSDEDKNGEYGPPRVVGVLSTQYCAEMIEYEHEIKEMFESALDTKKLRFNTKNIVWLNKNNGESKLQVSYTAYGNEPSTEEIYSYFAMVVQAPKKANAGDDEPAQKREREN
ncbi:unnamed protein product [Colletotrichum noveboracense]|uniref:Fe2OG dioxygenase domain-containing protein n=1 Tax=Colletotrichum noveboracense TaxID=2664923 RepID=A0A9W4RT12_9PEZI|nr:hypothetical protein K456DRAFT_1736157 [Colletotrichum gloeosporioides 23]KAJ0276234.1 hypothetical protein CBS470a_010902 [Colletotrichum nupharicola]KAJ0276499.1 hypothetical protein COL940_008228 [Colletotrichum noveboracense]KAJ0304630.1 hypothetical protein Brms1b_011171 [Colletotrichum noveboracense]CAI0646923.1 unnamed protein product [Colletotrichum noveboracense]